MGIEMATEEQKRGTPRIDLRLRIRYMLHGDAGEAEASDISPSGLRIEAEEPIDVGTPLKIEVDPGDGEVVYADAKISWCRERKSPSGKTIYDLGMAFDKSWLAGKRGAFGDALAQLFAMQGSEPARDSTRVPVKLKAETVSPTDVQLEVADISDGGMQLRASGRLAWNVKSGNAVIIEFEMGDSSTSIDGRVVWVAGQGTHATASGGPKITDSVGIKFGELSEVEQSLVRAVKSGEKTPERITVFVQS
jgi:hypothetical protein